MKFTDRLPEAGFFVDPIHGGWARVDDHYETVIHHDYESTDNGAFIFSCLNFDNDGETDEEREALAWDNAVRFRVDADGRWVDSNGIDRDTAETLYSDIMEVSA